MVCPITQGDHNYTNLHICGPQYRCYTFDPSVEERRKKKPQGKNIMACPITYGGHKQVLQRIWADHNGMSCVNSYSQKCDLSPGV